jgi:actin related protein 2/3 complex, subunit 3
LPCLVLPRSFNINSPTTYNAYFKKDLSVGDIVDEAIYFYRPNCFFRNFEINGGADRVLIYLLLFVQECIVQLAAKNPNAAEGQRLLTTHAMKSFPIPGDAGFPLNNLYERPPSKAEAGTYETITFLYLLFGP